MSGDWRVTLWQDDEDQRGGTYSVAVEAKRAGAGELHWMTLEHRTVANIEIGLRFAHDVIESELRR